jgi:SAM-dependent methyltransferase
MRIGPIPESPLERMLLSAGLLPVPLVDTMVALLLARTVMTATKVGLFEALAAGPLTPGEAASRCGTDARATAKLLFALAGARYVRARGSTYALTPMTRKWLLRESPSSQRDAVLHRYLDAALMEHAEDFVRSGEAVSFHTKMSAEQWGVYQRGQRAQAVFLAPEMARQTPLPMGARDMLDIGGGHGYYSVALCRRHPGLRSMVLDLPEAVAYSQRELSRAPVSDRIDYRVGDALTADLGCDVYDLVLVGNLVHHLDDPQNRDLMRRIAAALRSGGYCVVLEFLRPPSPRRAGQIGALTDFFFAMTSASGTWSAREVADWQRAAGLAIRRPIMLRTGPGLGLQAARKP